MIVETAHAGQLFGQAMVPDSGIGSSRGNRRAGIDGVILTSDPA
jgi:hypothetical protein